MTTTKHFSTSEYQDMLLQPASRLREMLNNPKPKLEEWQEEAGRMVSLLAIQFPQEVDEDRALLIVALVGLAAAMGVKEAKKKSLKLTRWAITPPSPVQTLHHLDEQRTALLALSKVKSPWALTYIEHSLANPELASDLLPELLRWARAAAPDWVSFVVGTYAAALASSTEGGRAIALLKDAPRILRLTDAIPADKVAEAISTFIRAITNASSRFTGDDKASVALLLTGYSVYEQAWQDMPTLLLQPVLINVLQQLSQAIGALKKQPPGSLDAASLATLSLVSDAIRRFGVLAIEQFQPMLPMWTAVFPDFHKQIQLAAVAEPALNNLLTPASVVTVVADQSYSAEAAFASLLPAWDAFVAGLSDPDHASSLSLMINRAAGTANVERHGVVGEVVAYDPLSHHLANPGEQTPVRVKVLRSGVLARRADGSQRILVQTWVTAA